MIEVIEIIEQEDGSAKLKLEISEEVLQYLIEYAINDILKDMIEKHKNRIEDDTIPDDFIFTNDMERYEDWEDEKYVGP